MKNPSKTDGFAQDQLKNKKQLNNQKSSIKQGLQFKSTKKRTLKRSSRSKSTVSSINPYSQAPWYLTCTQQNFRNSQINGQAQQVDALSYKNTIDKQNLDKNQLFQIFQNNFQVDLSNLKKQKNSNFKRFDEKNYFTDRTNNINNENRIIKRDGNNYIRKNQNFPTNNNIGYNMNYFLKDRHTGKQKQNTILSNIYSQRKYALRSSNVNNIDNFTQFSQRVKVKEFKNNKIKTKQRKVSQSQNNDWFSKPSINKNMKGKQQYQELMNLQVQIPFRTQNPSKYFASTNTELQNQTHSPDFKNKTKIYNEISHNHTRNRSQNLFLGIHKKQIKQSQANQMVKQFNFSKSNKISKVPSINQCVKTSSTFSGSQKNNFYLQISQFQLGLCFGEDIFGKVFPARHKKTGLILCIKQIIKRQVKHQIGKLIEYLKIHSFCSNPYIIDIYGFFQQRDRIYVLMEYHNQSQLFMRINNQRKATSRGDNCNKITNRISVVEALQFTENIVKAIKYLHDHGIVYRNIKPQNISLFYVLLDIVRIVAKQVTQAGAAKFLKINQDIQDPCSIVPPSYSLIVNSHIQIRTTYTPSNAISGQLAYFFTK